MNEWIDGWMNACVGSIDYANPLIEYGRLIE